MFRGHSDMREVIRWELEKERIREVIIAEEMMRRRILEAEVRRELMEREMMAMTMSNGGGFMPPFMPLSLPWSHNNPFDQRMLHHHQPFRGFEAVPFQQFGDSPKFKGIPMPASEDSKKKVIVLGKPNGATPAGPNQQPTPPVATGSSEPGSDGSKKKRKEEWSCAICKVTATTERIFNEHLQGKKHRAKEAALIAHKTGANIGLGVAPKKPIFEPVKLALTTLEPNPKTETKSVKVDSNDSNKKDKLKLWCEMCQVGPLCEKSMNGHKEGKKHLSRLLKLDQNVKTEAKVGTKSWKAKGKTVNEDDTIKT